MLLNSNMINGVMLVLYMFPTSHLLPWLGFPQDKHYKRSGPKVDQHTVLYINCHELCE